MSVIGTRRRVTLMHAPSLSSPDGTRSAASSCSAGPRGTEMSSRPRLIIVRRASALAKFGVQLAQNPPPRAVCDAYTRSRSLHRNVCAKAGADPATCRTSRRVGGQVAARGGATGYAIAWIALVVGSSPLNSARVIGRAPRREPAPIFGTLRRTNTVFGIVQIVQQFRAERIDLQLRGRVRGAFGSLCVRSDLGRMKWRVTWSVYSQRSNQPCANQIAEAHAAGRHCRTSA